MRGARPARRRATSNPLRAQFREKVSSGSVIRAKGVRNAPDTAPDTFSPRASDRLLDPENTLKDGHGTMTNWHYVDGASVMPSDEKVKALRPAK